MMVRLVKDGREVEVKDFLANLYIRNGYEVVTEKAMPREEAKAEPMAEPKEEPKRRTVRKTTAKK